MITEHVNLTGPVTATEDVSWTERLVILVIDHVIIRDNVIITERVIITVWITIKTYNHKIS